MLPISVPGVGMAAPLPAVQADGTRTRVAVIGGGIAGSGCAWALTESGYEVELFEGAGRRGRVARGCALIRAAAGRKTLSGNAHTFDWDVNGKEVRTCVSVTAWPPLLYKNYTLLLDRLGIETTGMPLSWFINSKVPGSEGFLWAADATESEGSLRQHFAEDFRRYSKVVPFVRSVTNFFTLDWFGGEPSMCAHGVRAGEHACPPGV